MAAKVQTFPKLNKADRETFDLYLESMVKVSRPTLVALMLGGMNSAPIVESPGKIGNAAWRKIHAAECVEYADETSRSVSAGSSQVETVRAFIVKRIAGAYREAFGTEFPSDAVKLTLSENGTVQLWRVR